MALPTEAGLRNAFAYGGRYLMPFETEDDYVTPLVNGQDLATPHEFGRLFSSSGANAGAAIFDSTPLGPNDPSQDRDLLVGLGNLLILQNSQAAGQSVPGVFDHPNDFPDLVVYDDEGKPLTVKYHLLSAVLLNELEKLYDHVQEQDQELEMLRDQDGKLARRIAALEAREASSVSSTGR